MSFMSNIYDPSKHKIYHPVNKEKYLGDKYPILRSSYEVKFCRWLDINPNVKFWNSEQIEIKYYDPTTNKVRRYFPDFFMRAIDKNGVVKNYVIEIKPFKETKPPRMAGKKKKQTLLYEQKVWLKNQAKWKAAIDWCKNNGCEFKILTEKQLMK